MLVAAKMILMILMIFDDFDDSDDWGVENDDDDDNDAKGSNRLPKVQFFKLCSKSSFGC